MSNDAQRLPDMSLSVHAIWSTPLFIIVAIALLIQLVGLSALAGLFFLALMIPVQGMLAAKQMGLQRAQMKQTESRVKVVNEVLQVRGARWLHSCAMGGGGDDFGRLLVVMCDVFHGVCVLLCCARDKTGIPFPSHPVKLETRNGRRRSTLLSLALHRF